MFSSAFISVYSLELS